MAGIHQVHDSCRECLEGGKWFSLRAKFKSWCSSSGLCPEVWFPNCNRIPSSQRREWTQNAPSFQPAGPASSFPSTQVCSTAAHGSTIKHQVGTPGRWETMEGEADRSAPFFVTSLGTMWGPITQLFSLLCFSFAKWANIHSVYLWLSGEAPEREQTHVQEDTICSTSMVESAATVPTPWTSLS